MCTHAFIYMCSLQTSKRDTLPPFLCAKGFGPRGSGDSFHRPRGGDGIPLVCIVSMHVHMCPRRLPRPSKLPEIQQHIVCVCLYGRGHHHNHHRHRHGFHRGSTGVPQGSTGVPRGFHEGSTGVPEGLQRVTQGCHRGSTGLHGGSAGPSGFHRTTQAPRLCSTGVTRGSTGATPGSVAMWVQPSSAQNHHEPDPTSPESAAHGTAHSPLSAVICMVRQALRWSVGQEIQLCSG